MLHQFYAVTQSGSLYCVSDWKVGRWPMVKKVAAMGSASVRTGMRLKNGALVGISLGSVGVIRGITMFDPHPEHGRRFWRIRTDLWGGGTSPLVGLFTRKREAERCMRLYARGKQRPHWKQATSRVIAAIGKDHPVFVVAPSYAVEIMRM